MRPLIYGNGTLLVCADERGIIRDFYYPYAGMENHGGYMRLGLYDAGVGAFGWLEDWKITQRYKSSFSRREFSFENGEAGGAALIGETMYEGPSATVTVWDLVHHDRNVFMRTMRVKNASDG
ncbi:MAG TPA: glycoside hydrolase family 15 protein, partial [Methanocellaceae archaeon]